MRTCGGSTARALPGCPRWDGRTDGRETESSESSLESRTRDKKQHVRRTCAIFPGTGRCCGTLSRFTRIRINKGATPRNERCATRSAGRRWKEGKKRGRNGERLRISAVIDAPNATGRCDTAGRDRRGRWCGRPAIRHVQFSSPSIRRSVSNFRSAVRSLARLRARAHATLPAVSHRGRLSRRPRSLLSSTSSRNLVDFPAAMPPSRGARISYPPQPSPSPPLSSTTSSSSS